MQVANAVTRVVRRAAAAEVLGGGDGDGYQQEKGSGQKHAEAV
jgi:hypothetical protein